MKPLNLIGFFLLAITAACDLGKPVRYEPPCYFDCTPFFTVIDFEPAWSPSGDKIAYVHVDSALGQSGIYIIDTSGLISTAVFLQSGAYSPRWSPDGLWIVFSYQNQIFKIRHTGDSLSQFTTSGRNFFPDWSHDGVYIAYDNTVCGSGIEPIPANSCGVLILNTMTASLQFISLYSRMPIWHPLEMRLLLVNRAVSPGGEETGDTLWTYDVEDKTRQFFAFLSGENFDNRYFRFSPDGLSLAFTSMSLSQRPHIWIMSSQGSNGRKIIEDIAYTCDWSPDGTRIVYADASNGHLQIVNIDGSNRKQITF